MQISPRTGLRITAFRWLLGFSALVWTLSNLLLNALPDPTLQQWLLPVTQISAIAAGVTLLFSIGPDYQSAWWKFQFPMIVVALCAVVMMLLSSSIYERFPTARVATHVGERTLAYEGTISDAGIEAIINTLVSLGCYPDQDDSCPTTFAINSPGGSTSSAYSMRLLLRRSGFNTILVDTLCASACASVLFPAFSNRMAYADSTIAWHTSRSALGIPLSGGSNDMQAHDMRAAVDLVDYGVIPSAALRMTNSDTLCTMTVGQLSGVGLPTKVIQRDPDGPTYGLARMTNCLSQPGGVLH